MVTVCAFSTGGSNGWVSLVSCLLPLLLPTTWAWCEMNCSMLTCLLVRGFYTHFHLNLRVAASTLHFKFFLCAASVAKKFVVKSFSLFHLLQAVVMLQFVCQRQSFFTVRESRKVQMMPWVGRKTWLKVVAKVYIMYVLRTIENIAIKIIIHPGVAFWRLNHSNLIPLVFHEEYRYMSYLIWNQISGFLMNFCYASKLSKFQSNKFEWDHHLCH